VGPEKKFVGRFVGPEKVQFHYFCLEIQRSKILNLQTGPRCAN